jgi:hypothetical protein
MATVQGMLVASRAWYHAPVAAFVSATPEDVLGRIAQRADFDIELEQRDAWLEQLRTLREQLAGVDGHVYLEFTIPRMGKRIDAVLVAGPVVFVIEFKTTRDDRAAINQAWDYALDLKNFHAASHHVRIAPLLVASEAGTRPISVNFAADGVMEPQAISPNHLRTAIESVLRAVADSPVDAREWESAPYRPTPTIIEAARALYAQHGVEAINTFDAGKQNLALTSGRIEEIVREARRESRKAICFVTGVPGAGKTLVGLNIATQHRESVDPAVFLSGNGPLVAVLREALTRDELERRRSRGEKPRKGRVAESVKAFIQNVHHFRDDNLQHTGPPPEHVAIFDEAQRAWNLQQTANFMKRKKGVPNFAQSEPEYLVSCMDRHTDWAVVVCLVGGGQEINTGEAGIAAWLEAMQTRFPHWRLHISANLHDSEYAAKGALEAALKRANAESDDNLHLAVSMRTYRAEHVSNFVKALLDRDVDSARSMYARFRERYPIRITRNLEAAKSWVRSHARGTQRRGMMCSSKAMRLKPHAIDVRHNVDPIHWFLGGEDDTRSSQYLEDAAAEFQVQGLEVDWAVVNWDADLRANDEGWSYHDFRGRRWVNIQSAPNQSYLINAYRVLLTRARQGMVIFVPPGDKRDATRNPAWYNQTFEYLRSVGIEPLD